MIDIRYHIATIVAVFVALGVGILIGSTLVGSDVLIEQQKKMITQLESQFTELRQREAEVTAENELVTKINSHYEEFSKAVSPTILQNRLLDYRVAIIVTGGGEIPSGLVNSISLAGAQIVSTTVVLPSIKINDPKLSLEISEHYQMGTDAPLDDLRKRVALTTAGVVLNSGDLEDREFLENANLVKFNGGYEGVVNGVIIVGGAEDEASYYPEAIDAWIIRSLHNAGKNVFACETSRSKLSYMSVYQSLDVSTVDDIDLTLGQLSMIRVIEGEAGDYGIKATAKKSMPSLPAEFLQGDL